MERSPGGPRSGARRSEGFTLVELLVATVVLAVILLLSLRLTDSASVLWRRTRAKIDAFQQARGAFEAVTRNLSQATLNVYWDYLDASGNPRTTGTGGNAASFVPDRYARFSELQFVSGPARDLLPDALDTEGGALQTMTQAVFFQAPLGYTSSLATQAGTTQLLNACGYFLEYADDTSEKPLFLRSAKVVPPRWRFRLVEFAQPSEKNAIYQTTATGGEWFRAPLRTAGNGTRRVLAENVVALILLPEFSPGDPLAREGKELAPRYAYDSWLYRDSDYDLAKLTRNQLPPLVRVTLVCVDEKSMARLDQTRGGDSSSPPDLGLEGLFQVSGSGRTYQQDLETLQRRLQEKRLTYRVFSTVVSIAQAKWSD